MREIFLAWSESLEQFVLEVIYGQRKGKRAALLRAALYPSPRFSPVAVKARRVLYNFRILRDSTLGVQVIAIGNITAGGTGKTPVVEKFARELQDAGRQVAILSRGYRSKPAPAHRRLLNKLLLREDITPPKIVSDGKSLLLDSETAGDEPYMLASNLKDVVVLVDKDRVKAGRYAIEKFGCDTLLLDDGFQYWKLRGRRQDVVLIDREQPFGNNGKMLPRGTLREPPYPPFPSQYNFHYKKRWQHGGIACEDCQLQPKGQYHRVCSQPSLFRRRFHRRPAWVGPVEREKSGCTQWDRTSGKFREEPDLLGGDLVYSKRFVDHHRFSQQEILNAINRSKTRQADMIVTTQKDAVRFPKIDRRDLPIYFMRVEIRILKGAKNFQDCVRQICFH